MTEPTSTKRRAVERRGGADGPTPAPALPNGDTAAASAAAVGGPNADRETSDNILTHTVSESPGFGAGPSLVSAVPSSIASAQALDTPQAQQVSSQVVAEARANSLAASRVAQAQAQAVANSLSGSSLAASLVRIPGPASAASMLRAAEVFAAEASTSPAALHAISASLISQAQKTGEALVMAQAQLTGIPIGSAAGAAAAAAPPGSSANAGEGQIAGVHRRTSEGGFRIDAPTADLLDYSSSLTAHISQAIARQQAMSAASSSSPAHTISSSSSHAQQSFAVGSTQSAAANANATSGSNTDITHELVAVARAEITDIAVRAAAQEAQAQGLVQEMMRTRSIQPTSTSAVGLGTGIGDRKGEQDSTTLHTAATASALLGAGVQSSALKRTSTDEARSSIGSNSSSGGRQPSSGVAAVDAYLANLGLAQIRVPLAAPAARSFASSSTMPTDITVPVPRSIATSQPFGQEVDQSSAAIPTKSTSMPAAATTDSRFQEQLGRRNAAGSTRARRWDESDPLADLKVGGVPSMPLMPAPALQMLPPPDSPAFLLEHFAKAARPGKVKGSAPAAGAAHRLEVTSAKSGTSLSFKPQRPAVKGAPNKMMDGERGTAPAIQVEGEDAQGKGQQESLMELKEGLAPLLIARQRQGQGDELSLSLGGQFPFQVVQTPGGTARPGWWIPTSALESGGAYSSSSAGAASSGKHSGQNGDNNAVRRASACFQPSYRTFTSDEFAALASAAAFTTAALTTKACRASATSQDGDTTMAGAAASGITLASGTAATGDGPTEARADEQTEWAPLSPHQQEQIAAQLRAWAGLEGPERQNEARKALEERKVQLLEDASTSGGALSVARAMENGGFDDFDAPIEQVPPSAFFPPDFASHYQAQLRALAEGYYERLHKEDLARSHFAASDAAAAAAAATLEQTARESRRASMSRITKDARQDDVVPSAGASVKGLLPNRKRTALEEERLDMEKLSHEQARNQQVIRNAVQSQNDAHYGMPGPAYGNGNQMPNLPPAQDPIQLIAAASGAAGVDVRSSQVRDQLLQFAHILYSTGSTTVPVSSASAGQDGSLSAGWAEKTAVTQLHPTLLPLLHTLHGLHPEHLPTLLLLSCAYYTAGDLPGSLWYNNLILRLDPQYVEAMSNIGTTLRALGRWREAESWWWRAVKLRPGYWDAYENLLGVLCSPRHVDTDTPSAFASAQQQRGEVKPVANGGLPSLPAHDLAAVKPKAAMTGPRFVEALRLCEFVERQITGMAISSHAHEKSAQPCTSGAYAPPIGCPFTLPAAQVPRLQNLYYGKGNLKYVLPDLGPVPAASEYEHAIEIVISPHTYLAYSTRDLIVAVCVVSVLSLGVETPGFPGSAAAFKVAQAMGLNLADQAQARLVATGAYASLMRGGVLALVRRAGDELVHMLVQLGGGHLPMFLLLPAPALRLAKIIFSETNGTLPSLATPIPGKRPSDPNALAQAIQQTNMTTSTVMLTLAKLYQDATASPTAGPHGALTLGGIPPSVSLLLPLYYMSLSLNASASTCNNLGILFSSIPTVTTVLDTAGRPQKVNGQSLAMQYYSHGLQLDAQHPHLYTNLGSLLKDLGHLSEAIKMYEKAVACNPKFDVALANLGNAIKDQGRTQDSVIYYRRAVEVNPNFPEALCGLVNALLAVCDWNEVYEADSPLMARVTELVNKQLDEGCHYGTGTMQLDRPLQSWIRIIANATGDWRHEAHAAWAERLSHFFAPVNQRDQTLGEGSFVIRLVEKLMRKMQRRWFLDLAAQSNAAGTVLRPSAADAARYVRPTLPTRMIAAAVPTVLPFHTFTYPLSARQIRLISHRNALRISQTTLTQMWLPAHVYPPPPLPAPTINVGYISSDFNNHPLAHLMQSCFGFHDRSRFNIHLYATTVSDQSPFRQKIEKEAQHFLDVSAWTNEQVIDRIIQDCIHILINLNGYTKGARNEIFAARPCPVQMEFMGFAGPLVSGWTDWVIADPIVCPPSFTSGDVWRKALSQSHANGGAGSYTHTAPLRPTDLDGDLDPEGPRDDWLYSERFIYMPHSYFVNDHKQGFQEDGSLEKAQTPEGLWRLEEQKRWVARKELFPNLPDDYIIFTDFNQLYKCEPSLFRLWLRILARVPKSILWLLRFPASGEPHLLASAREWAGDEVASRVVFTDVAPKHIHIQRGRIADLFLDTTECNAHTTAADILWSGTPVLTWPKHMHKMCSRVAASIVKATGLEAQLVVDSEQAYEDRAVQLAHALHYDYIDAQGCIVPPVQPATDTITADALAINNSASSAVPHYAPQAASQAGTAGATAPTSKHAIETGSAQTSAKKIAVQVTAPSASVKLLRGLQAPSGAVSRRSKGELSDLRKQLFLTREQSPLFDTRAWVRALERGYEEAWRRWVAGTDSEDTVEWQALPPDAPEKISSHIWVQPD
ncbi:glycosyltransferase family 41 protein [Tilletiaria anomala UBC 951]|uniref:protein O-GlcNAc transferase n=1 Tax=Tilletiaria anomala (strain ATCC 24038 / CBS 436.72 / UBC 951) TaxID=1037660 RepID=A0A066VGB9_TILAU|nr:glycosyltransferase family 41 protein [Tilletiaria anomala UBC 951]KDN40777.1 glycosyltransferase family 41 protein [Tilletiaria anomala UBC 951]